MGHYNGRVIEIRLETNGLREALVSCPHGAIPRAGQYVLASDPYDPAEKLGTALFMAEKTNQGFWAADPIPMSWSPGTTLDLVGPLGHGFDLPRNVQRLGLVALGDTISRLRPLIEPNGYSSGSKTLFTDLPLPRIPDYLESYPLASLADALDWPDFLVIDLPLHRISELRHLVGLPAGTDLTCPAQILLTTPMPCAGMAKCGACAVPARRGWSLSCEDGPVFDLHQLKW